MTVGEKLLHLRKQHNLSQEELAKCLLVSRQTISLWETNQSLPTIENLIRLREIFSVPVDEILLCAEERQSEQPPLQAMEYTLSPEDYQKSFRPCNEKYFKRCHFLLIAGILMALLAWTIPEYELTVALILLATMWIISALRNLKTLNLQKSNLPSHTVFYRWALFETDFTVSTYRDDVQTLFVRAKYTDIAQVWRYEDKAVLLVKNSLYILPTPLLNAESPLQPIISRHTTAKPIKTNLEKWGTVLFWLTIAAFFAAGYHALMLPYVAGGLATAYMWHMWLALPIPIGCIVLGFVLKRRGLRWRKNVICGFIIAALLGLLGSFSWIFQPLVNDDGVAFLSQVEQETGIDFPDSDYSHLSDTISFAPGNDQIFPLSRYYASLSNYDQKAMNAQLITDERWFTGVPYELLPCIPLDNINPDADFFLLYDITTQTFNTIPDSMGSHTMLYITYHSGYGSLEILKYEYICD